MKRILLLGLVLPLLALACAGQPDSEGQGKGKNSAPPLDKNKYLLAQEPPSPQSVLELRDKGKDGESVAVVGRIGGRKDPFTTGQAAFMIADCSFEPCAEDGMNPWEFCCEPNLDKGTVLVKFVDAGGQTLPHDAEQGLTLAPLATVVVQGKLHRRDGAVVIVASGVFVKSK